MPRLTPYLGIALALAIGASIGFFSSSVAVVYAPEATLGSTTPTALPQPNSPTLATTSSSIVPARPASEASTASSTPASVTTLAKVRAKVAKVAEAPLKTPPDQTIVTVESSGSLPLDSVATTLRGALVNILCYAPLVGRISSITGSGVIIDAKGIILTNAHIAQYLLLADRGVKCTIRTGSPAVDTYGAELIYLSPSWIRANPKVITQFQPTGTGEYDFALLAITKSLTTSPLPATFPYLPLAQLPPAPGAPVVIGSYGAQFLDASQVQASLSPTLVYGSIKEVLTFEGNTIDVLALGGSVAAQEGSSGGGVASASGTLVGTITTSTVEGATDTRRLSAITASYIRLQYAREMNSALDTLLAEPVASAIADFAPQIPTLEAIIAPKL